MVGRVVAVVEGAALCVVKNFLGVVVWREAWVRRGGLAWSGVRTWGFAAEVVRIGKVGLRGLLGVEI